MCIYNYFLSDGIVDVEGEDVPIHEISSDPFHPTHEWQPVKEGKLELCLLNPSTGSTKLMKK